MQRARGAAWVILACLTTGAAAALIGGCATTPQTEGERAVVTVTRSKSSRATARTEPIPTRGVSITIDARSSVLYLDRLLDAVARTRVQMPQIIASAELAASRVTRGARLFVGGTQQDFPGEMIERAGGLAMAAAVPRVLNRGDVVLYAVASRMTVA